MNSSTTHALPITLLACSILAVGCSNGREGGVPARDTDSRMDTPMQSVPDFDRERAFDDLLRIVSFGPRNPGSDGHRKGLNHLWITLNRLADSVTIQPFTHKGYGGEVLILNNVIASFRPDVSTRILLCTHWDTRPRADRDPDPARRDEPILGANDGASGVAVLFEIARQLHQNPPPVGVDLVFFDGEDYGYEGDLPNYLLGSRYFASSKPPGYVPRFGILIDMIGDTELEIPKEGHSVSYAPDVIDLVWGKARSLGYHQFSDRFEQPITDDHLPLNVVGIKTIDLIDFSYPDESHRYWHTHSDTPDHCSPESLGAVGTVLLHVLYSQTP